MDQMTQGMFGEPYATEMANARAKAVLAATLQKMYGGTPQGGMVGNIYVKPSWTQNLSQLTNTLLAAKLGQEATKDTAKVQQQYMADQSKDVARMQELAQGSPGDPNTANFVMAPDERGNVPTANSPAVPANPLAAENYGERSNFAATRELAKAMRENRLKEQAKMREEIAKRVAVQDIPNVYAGQTAGLAPKSNVQFVDGLPISTPSEWSPGSQPPQRIGEGYSSVSVPGVGGTMAAQKNPLTGKVDVLDKSPKVSVSTGKDEDPYWKEVHQRLGKADADTVIAARQAPEILDTISRLRKLHGDSKGQWTGGPQADRARLLRDTASQFNVPIDPNVDLNNARMQAEFANLIATQILGQGRGLTDEDVRNLKNAFPSDRLTPAMFPAFLDQYERMVRARAMRGNTVLETMRQGKGAAAPTSLRPNPLPASSGGLSGMSTEELEARRQQLLNGGGGQ